MNRLQFSTRRMIAIVAVAAGCLMIVRVEPALDAWLLLLIIPASSWTAVQAEIQAIEGRKMEFAERVSLFMNTLMWCVSLIVVLFVAVLLISQRFEFL